MDNYTHSNPFSGNGQDNRAVRPDKHLTALQLRDISPLLAEALDNLPGDRLDETSRTPQEWALFDPAVGRAFERYYQGELHTTKPGKNGAAPDQDGKKPVPTDDELRDRWHDEHPHTAYGLGEWRRYTGGVWLAVQETTIRQEIVGVLEAAKPEGVRPSARLCNSVLDLARWKVSIPAEKWDADPDILVCSNGALYIPDRRLMAHSPDYYATSRLDYAYDPAARSDAWDKVVQTSLGDNAEFVQEFAGLALTTDTKHEIAVWFYGPPGTGKSTVLTGLQAMLGERAGLLGLADIERSRFSLTNLPGKTLVVSAEQPVGLAMATHLLNSIISGEKITVDRKFREPVDIVPRAKIAWAMNDFPRIPNSDDGLFRRVKVVEFPDLPENQRDPLLKEQIRQSGAAVLNWALDGLQRLRERGKFLPPASVLDATKQFMAENDIPAAFVAEKCITGPDKRAGASLLYTAYKNWCFDTGHKPLSSTSVAKEWRRLGFEKYLSGGRSIWSGVGLVDYDR